MMGTLAECLATVFVVYADGLCYKRFRSTIVAHVAASVVVAATVVAGLRSLSLFSLCVAGLNITGMYLNPVLATTANFGCSGSEQWEHAMVYWLGPVLGLLVVHFGK